MKIKRVSFLIILLAVCYSFGGSAYDPSNIEVGTLEYVPPFPRQSSWPNRQIFGPCILKLRTDLKTEQLHIFCRYCDYGVEDCDAVKIEKVIVSSKDDNRTISGCMSKLLWTSDDPVKDIGLQEGDVIKGVISARIGTQQYIYNNVNNDTEIEAYGIDFKVGSCPHGNCFKSFRLSGDQRSRIKCISASIIDKSKFKDAGIRICNITSEVGGHFVNSLFRHSLDKSEICIDSFAKGRDAFPIEAKVVVYESVTTEFAINCSPQQLDEDAIMAKEYLKKSSSSGNWKLYTMSGIVVLAGIAGVWILRNN